MILEFFVFGAGDDLILDLLAKFDPVLGKPGNPDKQAPVFFRFCLCLAEQAGIHDVKLHMKSAFAQVCTDKFQEFPGTLPSADDGGMDLHVKLGVL